jgi:Ca2+-transporting ATPase
MNKGLTAQVARSRLQQNGYNELPSAKEKHILDILLEIIREPMIVLLIAASGLYLLLGDKTEAILLLLSIGVVISISLYQERRSEKSLQALTALSSPRAVVVRDGKEIRIPGREVVVGDLVLLSEGDRVPADMRLTSATNLSVDESMLTGESVPVSKNTKDENLAYSGTMVVSGHGYGEVTSTGLSTELGKIGHSLRSIEVERTLLQKEITTFVRWIAIVGVMLCILLALFSIMRDGKIIEGILAGLTLAIGILPEEFPIVLLLFMTMGAWRLTKHNVLTRRAAAIETLGGATVICTDKTGTITKNEMAITKVLAEEGQNEHTLITYGILASQRKPFDPMETAFIEEGRRYFDTEALYDGYELAKEYPLNEEYFCVAHAYKKSPDSFDIALKGAPESVLDLCHIPENERTHILEKVRGLAQEGLRVIAVAKAEHKGHILPEERHDIPFTFLGLVGLADPVRDGVKESVRAANDAGIRIIMITGDYKETALNIAEQIGLVSSSVVTGDEFEKMSDEEKRDMITKTNIFSRVRPHQKLIIVRTLKELGEVVAMTGDGVNDAPALKAAHIGVAMGKRGTDVAREAASIVLLDDNFNSIVSGIKMGRRIYDNLQKAINYLVAVHIPIIILSILPVVFGTPLILMPIHIVFLEMIIDPTCTIVFEADKADKDIMGRRPRRLGDRIVAWKNLLSPIISGTAIGGIIFVAYLLVLPSFGETIARTYAFLLLIALVVVLILVNLSKRENIISKLRTNDNTTLGIVLAITALVMFLATTVEPVMRIFRFEPLSMLQFVEIAGIALSFLLISEFAKFAGKRQTSA